MENQKLLKKYWQQAKFLGWLLQIVPFIRMIAVTGSLARGESRSSSDIDFFIIGRAGRLWIVRFCCLFLTQILGQRARGENTAGKTCLNRFLADDYILVNPRNHYHAQEYSRIVVLFNINNTHTKFISINRWMQKYIKKHPKILKNQKSWLVGILRSIKEFILKGWLGDWVEKKLKNWQLRQIKTNPFYHQAGSRLVVNDKEIFFHQKPR